MKGGTEVGEEGDYIPITYTVTTRMNSCIKMGSDESHFSVSLIVRDNSHKTMSTNHNF